MPYRSDKWVLAPAPCQLTFIDDFEGDEYHRIKVTTSTDIECWVYEYKYDISKFKNIKSGDWMLR